MRKAIDLKRVDDAYVEHEERLSLERRKKGVLTGAFVLGVVGMLGSLALRTAGIFTNKRFL